MVTVLLTCYRGEKYLPRQLATLRTQTESFRALVRDDGSPDGTAALLEEVVRRDERFRLAADHGTHRGAAEGFLSLIRQSEGEFVALCDQDDVWHRAKLWTLRQAMEKAQAQVGEDVPLLVHSDCRVVDAQEKVLHQSLFRHQGWNGKTTALAPLLAQNNVTGCTLMMNRALANLVGKYAPEGLTMHDWFIALTAAAFGQIVFVDERLMDYRQHGDNAMGASAHGLLRRGAEALRSPEKVRARLTLAYGNAEAFLWAYDGVLPEDAEAVVRRFLAIRSMSRGKRAAALLRGGYLMQNPLMRVGQMIF